jgi:exopolysaccharide biosynthesis polyprenyl glycosylphosphotransferase
MIRRRAATLHALLALVDFASALAVFVLVSYLRHGSTWAAVWEASAGDVRLLALGFGACWVATLWLLGMYRLRARWTWRAEAIDLLRAVFILAILTFAFLFVAKLPDVSRLLLVMLFVTLAAVALSSRGSLRLLARAMRERGRSTRYVLIVGHGPSALDFAGRLQRYPYLGMKVVGYLADPDAGDARPGDPVAAGDHAFSTSATTPGPGTLAHLDEIDAVLRTRVIDEIAICLAPENAAFVEPVARLCEEHGLVVRIPLYDGVGAVPGGRIEEFSGIRLQTLTRGPDHTIALLAKRAIDIVGGIAALVVFSPLIIGSAIAIRREGPGPVFFRQTRLGLRGRPFQVVKLRTMVTDAEELKDSLTERNEITGHAFKLTDDPRVTRVGAFLRRTSFDELPQFWNVVRGEMSIVGPRPPLPEEVSAYDIWHRRRLAMKPGITGLWQVSARREEEFDRWVRIDLDYIDRWSLWLDIKIMLRTVPAMLEGR